MIPVHAVILSQISLQILWSRNRDLKTTHNTFGVCFMHFSTFFDNLSQTAVYKKKMYSKYFNKKRMIILGLKNREIVAVVHQVRFI